MKSTSLVILDLKEIDRNATGSSPAKTMQHPCDGAAYF